MKVQIILFILYSILSVSKDYGEINIGNTLNPAIYRKKEFRGTNKPLKDFHSLYIHSLCIYLMFYDFINHLAIIIKTKQNVYFQLDLRLTGTKPEWYLVLQIDDPMKRNKEKFEDKANCYPIEHKGLVTMKDVDMLMNKFLNETIYLDFYFKFATELKTMDEWKEMLDYDHEKAKQRLSCFSFTDYFMKSVANKNEKDGIVNEILIRGQTIIDEPMKCCNKHKEFRNQGVSK